MTNKELKETTMYKNLIKKIESYSIGFEFTLKYYEMTEGEKRVIDTLMNDCIKRGLIKSISMGLSLFGEVTAETFRRIEKK